MPGLFPDTDRYGLPQTTLSGLYYEVDAFTYREAWVPGANKTTIVCRVDAEDSFQWITDMVGQVYVEGGVLRRDLPEQNPFDDNQFCTRVEQIDQGGLKDGANDSEGDLVDVASGWPFTKWQRYQCTFEGMPFAMRTDTDADAAASAISSKAELMRYCVRGQKSYAREQQFPGGAFCVDGTTTPLGQTGFRTRVFGDVTYTLVRWPVANFPSAWKTLRGKISDATFDSTSGSGEGYEWAAGELLYVGYDDNNKYFDANEQWVADVVLSFRFCQDGWNKFFKNDGTLVSVSVGGAGVVRPYTTGDFKTLFQV